jgi:hypothetical protein
MSNTQIGYQGNLTLGDFWSRHSLPCLLIIDFETRRVTVEKPLTEMCLDSWIQEVDRAFNSGRHVAFIPISESCALKMESVSAELGYSLWPSQSIISLPV